MRVTYYNAPKLGKCWEKKSDKSLLWPENPKIPAREIWQHAYTGDVIIRRYNVVGDLLYSNEEEYGFRLAM